MLRQSWLIGNCAIFNASLIYVSCETNLRFPYDVKKLFLSCVVAFTEKIGYLPLSLAMGLCLMLVLFL